MAMVSRNFCETNNTANSTKKLPKHEAIIIPYEDMIIDDAKLGNNPAPRIIMATPKLEPELNPKT